MPRIRRIKRIICRVASIVLKHLFFAITFDLVNAGSIQFCCANSFSFIYFTVDSLTFFIVCVTDSGNLGSSISNSKQSTLTL